MYCSLIIICDVAMSIMLGLFCCCYCCFSFLYRIRFFYLFFIHIFIYILFVYILYGLNIATISIYLYSLCFHIHSSNGFFFLFFFSSIRVLAFCIYCCYIILSFLLSLTVGLIPHKQRRNVFRSVRRYHWGENDAF